jgi:hypothetical protein
VADEAAAVSTHPIESMNSVPGGGRPIRVLLAPSTVASTAAARSCAVPP